MQDRSAGLWHGWVTRAQVGAHGWVIPVCMATVGIAVLRSACHRDMGNSLDGVFPSIGACSTAEPALPDEGFRKLSSGNVRRT